MLKIKNYNVIICGSGILGSSCALFLKQRSVERICVLEAGHGVLQEQNPSLGCLWPSPNDPPTRARVAHGNEVADYLLKQHILGVELFQTKIIPALAKEIKKQNVGLLWQQTPAHRYAAQPYEAAELEKEWPGRSDGPWYTEEGKALVCTDWPGFQKNMAGALGQSQEITLKTGHRVLTLEEGPHGCTLTAQGPLGKVTFTSELVIVATGCQTVTLLPAYGEVLVPMVDIFQRASCSSFPGSFKSAVRGAFGHWALIKNGQGRGISMTGPRYVLPDAGANQTTVKNPEIFLDKSQKFFEKLIKAPINWQGAAMGTDVWPCDELPLVGEWGRQGRILSSCGWLASGLSAQVAMAHHLTDLVTKGSCNNLHPRLHPRRLFYKVF